VWSKGTLSIAEENFFPHSTKQYGNIEGITQGRLISRTVPVFFYSCYAGSREGTQEIIDESATSMIIPACPCSKLGKNSVSSFQTFPAVGGVFPQSIHL